MATRKRRPKHELKLTLRSDSKDNPSLWNDASSYYITHHEGMTRVCYTSYYSGREITFIVPSASIYALECISPRLSDEDGAE